MGSRQRHDAAVQVAVMAAAWRHQRFHRPVMRAAVAAVADALDAQPVTRADLQAFADVFAEAVADAVRDGLSTAQVVARIEARAPMFGRVGQLLQDNQGLLQWIAIIVGVITGVLQLAAPSDQHSGSAPNAQVTIAPADRAEIERIVEQRLREHDGAGDHDGAAFEHPNGGTTG